MLWYAKDFRNYKQLKSSDISNN